MLLLRLDRRDERVILGKIRRITTRDRSRAKSVVLFLLHEVIHFQVVAISCFIVDVEIG